MATALQSVVVVRGGDVLQMGVRSCVVTRAIVVARLGVASGPDAAGVGVGLTLIIVLQIDQNICGK